MDSFTIRLRFCGVEKNEEQAFQFDSCNSGHIIDKFGILFCVYDEI